MSGSAKEDPTYVYFGDFLLKSEDDSGNLIVSGKAAGPDLDLDRQILDADWLASAMPEWMKIGNIRQQHDMHKPIGKATKHTEKDDGHWITAKIVDPEAQKLIREEVLTGFSVGIKNPSIDMSTKALTKAPGGIINGGTVVEVSAVDRACNSSCALTLAKAAKPEAAVLPEGVEPQTDKGLVRTEEIVKVTTTGGHFHLHTHEDGAHAHAHAHSPMPGHHDHGDEGSPPHSHAHDPKDAPRIEPTGQAVTTSQTGDQLSEPARDKGAVIDPTKDQFGWPGQNDAPKLDGGPQSAEELHKAAMARLEAKGFVVDVAKSADASEVDPTSGATPQTAPGTSDDEPAPLPVPDPDAPVAPEPVDDAPKGAAVSFGGFSLEQFQAMVDEAVEKAVKGKVDPAKPHAFVGDGKTYEACGKARDEAMHHKSFGNGKAAEPDVVKKDYSTEKRIELAKKGQAIPIRNDKGEITGGRYPIADGGDLDDAIKSFGRAKDSDADDVKAFIKKRAKALGMSDKIPDGWKVADFDAAKVLLLEKGLLTKDAGDKPDHSAAYAQACAGLAQLIQNEAQELANGDDEYWSLSCLLQAISGLRSWRIGEAKEGEMDAMDLNRPSYDYMAATAELTKAIGGMPALIASEVAKAIGRSPEPEVIEKAAPTNSTDALLSAMRAEIDKAMKPFEGMKALAGEMAEVKATVDRIAKAPQANGPRRLGVARTAVTEKSPVESHREKAAEYRNKAAQTSNNDMRTGYLALADDEDAAAKRLEQQEAKAAG